jgi:thiosulfate dehydrogenase
MAHIRTNIKSTFMRPIYLLLFFIVTGMGILFAWDKHSRSASATYNSQAFKHEFVVVKAHHLLGFNLVDPEQAPPQIRDSVMRGYRVIMNTAYYAPNYAHDELSCTNCHFAGGDSLGGRNGGISLVGVTTAYPRFSKRSGKVLSLADRVNNCFQRSLNGKPLPINSKMMKDILNYLAWISKEVESIKDIPWLGLPVIKSKHTPDPSNGQKIYEDHCSACHQLDGRGGGVLGEIDRKTIPPLWGAISFNDGAGMSTMAMLAPFIYLNMPYQQAMLTEEQALDVAAFILKQPRPHFIH